MAENGTGTAGNAGGAGASVRLDAWIWSVRLAKTRSQAADACKGGHVRVNGEKVKPAQALKVGDQVRVRRSDGWERIVTVTRLISKRVGPPVAAECYLDQSPPPPAREYAGPTAIRDRGAGRPTKRERREVDRLRGR
ncbi:RNA-binding S4 domain-containing protein [Actinospica sp. MGRD01-02]|uniref:RNA-binding S4 domain-containing protein n=1 Tax=Actinospica acidithermotolerans TaxID=2828514 RepID=A0A941EP26_9ACTN|nr:RNA-binding S4 domain-containing protein [Actinospica acidithermotolerans]MBR7831139.1 RNA-binding S4 domain-containing protein [Actinospica acidithermotolerans]